MKMKTVAWLITATSLVMVGCILFGGMMMALGWDFTKLSTTKYETNTHEILDVVNSIHIETTMANTTFLPADDNICKVLCYETANEKHSVTVENGCLTIRLKNEKKWYDYIGLHFASPKLTVYLPRGFYESVCVDITTGHVDIPKDFKFGNVDVSGTTGDVAILSSVSGVLNVQTSTGDITICDTTVGVMNLNVSTGKITVSDVACVGDVNLHVTTGRVIVTELTCNSFTTGGKTGNLSLDNVIVTKIMTIHRTTGDVKFNACDAAEIYVKTDTGRVTGTLLSDKVFMYQTSTGDVELPKTNTGGMCEVITSTGDIRLKIIG